MVARIESQSGGSPKEKEIVPTLLPVGWSSIEDISGDRILVSRSVGEGKRMGLWRPTIASRWVVPLGGWYPPGTQATLLPSGVIILSKRKVGYALAEYSDGGVSRGEPEIKYPNTELLKTIGASSEKVFVSILLNDDKDKNKDKDKSNIAMSLGWGILDDAGKWSYDLQDLDLQSCKIRANEGTLNVIGATVIGNKKMVGFSIQWKEGKGAIEKHALAWAQKSEGNKTSCRVISEHLGEVIFLQTKKQDSVVLLADVGKELWAFELKDALAEQVGSKAIQISSVAPKSVSEYRRLTRVTENEAVLLSQVEFATVPRGDIIQLDEKLELVVAPIGFSVGADVRIGRIMRTSGGMTPGIDVSVSVLGLQSGESLFTSSFKDSNLQNFYLVSKGTKFVYTPRRSLLSIGGATENLRIFDLDTRSKEGIAIDLACPHRCRVLESADDAFWVVKYGSSDSAESVYRFEMKDKKPTIKSKKDLTTLKIPKPVIAEGKDLCCYRWDILDRMTPSMFPYEDIYAIAPVWDAVMAQSQEGNVEEAYDKGPIKKVDMVLFGDEIKDPKMQSFEMKRPEYLVGGSFAQRPGVNGIAPVFFFRSPDSFYWTWLKDGISKIERGIDNLAGFQSISYALARDQKTAVVVGWKADSVGLVGETLSLLDLSTPQPRFLECTGSGCPAGQNKPRVSDQFLSGLSGPPGRSYDDAPTEFLTLLQPGHFPTVGLPFSSCLTFFSKENQGDSKYSKTPGIQTLPYASWVVPLVTAEGEEEKKEKTGDESVKERVKSKKGAWLASTKNSWEVYTWEDQAPVFSGCTQ
jgi:hypothetical protein